MSTLTKYLNYRLLTGVALVAIVLGGCAAAAPNRAVQSQEAGGAPMAAPSYDKSSAEGPAVEYAPEALESPAQNQSQERIVIKNASLSVVVPDPAKSMDRISAMAESMGGFVVSAQVSKQYLGNGIEAPRASVTIRVPAKRLDEALKTIQAESDEAPDNLSINSQDVTSEYVDLKSRQANLEAAEKELVRIMEGATRTEDVMMVYNQLVSIREQIEVIKGQIKYYEESAALSAISIELIADAANKPIEIGGWKPTGIAKEAIEALLKTLQGLGTFIIWLVIYVLPVLIVLFIIFVLPLILIIRAWRKRRRARKAISTTPSEPTA